MYGHTGNNWSDRNGNKRFKGNFVSHSSKTFNRVTTKDSCTWNITRNTGSTAVWNLKPERWGSPLVKEEKYQGENACDKIQYNNNNNNNNNGVQWGYLPINPMLFGFGLFLNYFSWLQEDRPGPLGCLCVCVCVRRTYIVLNPIFWVVEFNMWITFSLPRRQAGYLCCTECC
jgi:hypothetical protein